MRGFTVGFSTSLVGVLWLGGNSAISIAVLPWFGLFIFPFVSNAIRSFIFGLCIGGVLAHAQLFLQFRHQLESVNGKVDLLVEGTVASIPIHDERRTSFLFQIDEIKHVEKGTWPDQVRLSWYGGERNSVLAGDRWRFQVRLKAGTSLGNPGGFNYERWLFTHRIHATGYVRDSPAPQRLTRNAFRLNSIREKLAKQILALPSANDYAALVQGLTVGVTSGISLEQWQTLRQSGTAHLLAISGLHIGLISGWFLLFAKFVWRLFQFKPRNGQSRIGIRPVFALTISCLSAAVYAALAGFSLPTQRALIMLSVFALAVVLRRVWPPGSALLAALLLVLLFDPLSVLSVGFWLSFGTVAALFYLHNGRLSKRGNKVGALVLHLKLGVVLLPATTWFFQQGSFIAPVANAIAVPVVGLFVVPASFVIALLTQVWPSAASALLHANQWVLQQLLSFLDWLLLIPASSLSLFLPGPLTLLCALISLMLLFSPRNLRLRWMAVPLLAPAIVFNVIGKPVKGLELHVLDVGQGLSAVLLTENHTLLFDTGKRISDKATMFDRVVMPYLIAQGRSNIDVAVISHGDDDHAGGIESLLSTYPNTNLYSSDTQHQTELNALPCLAGETFSLDEATFTFLHPSVADLGSTNNLSCVLLVHMGNSRILLTGDIESESERLLVERLGESLSADVLIAPHHGSRSSSTQMFVNAVPSDIVIYAAGHNNKFSFPHDDVVKRYALSGAKAFNTGHHGALKMQFDKDGLRGSVEWFWRNKRRYHR